jgi:TM2 domain-containing membrane protein YozV
MSKVKQILINQKIQKLNPSQAVIYHSNSKNWSTAFLLAFFLGAFGAHLFYLQKKVPAILCIIFFWTLIPGICAFFWLFMSSDSVQSYNLELLNMLIPSNQDVFSEK